jgi:proline iminopeptidase
MKRGTVRIAGAELGFTIEGSGAPLLVAGSSIYYPRTFSDRLKRSRTLVCADLPHFADLPPGFRTEAIGFDLYADCIEAVRAATGFDRVAIAGHSHHGNVALEYAKRYAQYVAQVVLIGTPPVDLEQTLAAGRHYWDAHASNRRKALLQQRRNGLDPERLAQLPAHQAYVARYVADAPRYWHDPTYDAAWLWRDMTFAMTAVDAFRALFRSYALSRDDRALAAPLLVIAGRDDYAVPHTLWQPLLPQLRQVTFHLLQRSGHTPQLEQPEVFDRIVLDWMDRHDRQID